MRIVYIRIISSIDYVYKCVASFSIGANGLNIYILMWINFSANNNNTFTAYTFIFLATDIFLCYVLI